MMYRNSFIVTLLVLLAASVLTAEASFANSGRLKLMNAAARMIHGPGEPVPPVVIDLSLFNCGPNYTTPLTFPPTATDSVAPSTAAATTATPATTATTSAMPSEEPTTDSPVDTPTDFTDGVTEEPTTATTTPTSAPTVTQGQGSTAPASNAPQASVEGTTKPGSQFSTSFSTKFTVPVGSPVRITFPPVTGLLSAPCAMESVLSMPIETFSKSSDSFVDAITNVLNKKYQVQVTLNSFTAGSTIVVFSVNGYAPGATAIRDMIIAEKENAESDLATIFGMQSVSIVSLVALTNSPVTNDGNAVGAAVLPDGQDSGAAATNGQNTKNSKSDNAKLFGIAIGAGVAGGIIVMIIGFAIMKRRNITSSFASNPESQLRNMTKEVNGANINQLRVLGDRAQQIFRTSCTCENTGVCGVCAAYKVFLHDCSWCRTEFVVTELTSIIGRARGPDVTEIQASLENRVDELSMQCGCHFGREWSEPAAGVCPHEALVAEFCEAVRVQNIENRRPLDHAIQF